MCRPWCSARSARRRRGESRPMSAGWRKDGSGWAPIPGARRGIDAVGNITKGNFMFGNARVATRLAFGFGLTIVLILVVAFISTARMQSLNADLSRFVKQRAPMIDKIG